jgi:serine phosphatase RsbU (regulator of sigma subunit)
MHITRKIGILFIVIFSLTLTLSIWKNEVIFQPLFVLLIILSVIGLPFGFSLIAFNNKTNIVKNIYLAISVFLILGGIFSKFLNFPGAGIELIIGILFFCFAYSPLQLKYKYNKWLPFSKSKFESLLLSTIDYIGITLLSIGILSKIQWWPYAGLEMYLGALILLIGLFLWNFKFKSEIIRRKEAEDKIKEQYHEIQDSINYAKRIQSAILPPLKSISDALPNSFVFYQPKDVVAGDFYWFEKTTHHSPPLEGAKGVVLIAAADCTGHGVPGAMVSVICNNSLNRSFREYHLTQPNEILDKTREIVISEFEKSEEEMKDGMDVSLAALSPNQNDSSNPYPYNLVWSGANNPLWVIRKNTLELEEYKGDKQPIGKHSSPKPFSSHLIKLNEGDTFYLFTDGFADQFGGPKGKKFMYKAFKELLLSIQNLSMDEQKDYLENSLLKWRGNLEQVDDICIIGIKI